MRALAALALLWSASLAAADAPFLWRVQGPAATHYLLGSVHLLPESAYPLPAALDQAYAQTQTLVLETDPAALATPQAQSRMLAAGLAEQGLASLIPAPLYARLQATAQQRELPAGVCDRFKAWFCALTLSVLEFQDAGLVLSHGLDQHYFDRAVRDERAIGWLESPEFQLGLFAGMDAVLSEQFLASTLDDLERPDRSPGELLRVWRDNDVPRMTQLVEDARTRYPASHEHLLAQRNRDWMAPLMERLRSVTPQLIVVGAAHLVSADGLVALLQAQGFELRAMALDEPAPVPAPAPEAPP